MERRANYANPSCITRGYRYKVAKQITEVYQPPHDLPRKALEQFITHLSHSTVVSSAVFVDRQETTFRPRCDIHTFASSELDYSQDGDVLRALYTAHADLVWKSEQRGSRRDSHLLVRDLPDGALPQSGLDTVREELQDVPAARVIAAIVFPTPASPNVI